MKITRGKDFIRFKATSAGPKSVVFAGVHGNETGGISAVKELLKNFTIDFGSVVFVFGNPEAIKSKVRFTEFNLNRAFKNEDQYSDEVKNTYEYKRAQVLKKYLQDSDVLLDIHSSSNSKSEPFVICERNAKEIINYFPKEFKKIVHGFDDIEPGGTDWYMNSLGKIGICIECGFHENPRAITLAKETIMDFLIARGHFKNKDSQVSANYRCYVQMINLYNTKSDSFVIAKNFADFEELKKGDIIGVDGGTDVVADKNCIILFPQSKKKTGEEAFLLGEKIYK